MNPFYADVIKLFKWWLFINLFTYDFRKLKHKKEKMKHKKHERDIDNKETEFLKGFV